MNSTQLPQAAIVARRVMFSAAHFYRQEKFSEAENRETFGRCFSAHGHGHNYVIEGWFEGPIDHRTKLVVDLADADRLLKLAAEPLDHHHLNFDVPEFRSVIPTTEQIAVYLETRVTQLMKDPAFGLPPELILRGLRLFESDDLWVELWRN